ncbi:histone chaperone [Thelephora terrestris]|uniref:Anti-silencing function protein 1 n=1 Tax=Thelephora terrestris TaxID=56493 RepID=A0A9P6L6B7_9AGAM|nr:histone chaperone [Thelephora terrestris]
MSIVAIRVKRRVSNYPARFLDPYYLHVTFEYIAPLEDDFNQELDDHLVGPVPVGINSFEFEGCTPDPKKIPKEDVLGIAALILARSYKEQEFVWAGYDQNTEWQAEDGRMPNRTGDIDPDNKKEKQGKEKERCRT